MPARNDAAIAAYVADMTAVLADPATADMADWEPRPHPDKATNNKDGSPRVRYETQLDPGTGRPVYTESGEPVRVATADPVMQSVANRWREWYLEEETGELDEFRMGISVLYDALGSVKGKSVMGALEAHDPYLVDLMREGHGLDICHRDFTAIATSLKGEAGLDDTDLEPIVALKKATGPRHVVRGLPEPREPFLIAALETIDAS